MKQKNLSIYCNSNVEWHIKLKNDIRRNGVLGCLCPYLLSSKTNLMIYKKILNAVINAPADDIAPTGYVNRRTRGIFVYTLIILFSARKQQRGLGSTSRVLGRKDLTMRKRSTTFFERENYIFGIQKFKGGRPLALLATPKLPLKNQS